MSDHERFMAIAIEEAKPAPPWASSRSARSLSATARSSAAAEPEGVDLRHDSAFRNVGDQVRDNKLNHRSCRTACSTAPASRVRCAAARSSTAGIKTMVIGARNRHIKAPGQGRLQLQELYGGAFRRDGRMGPEGDRRRARGRMRGALSRLARRADPVSARSVDLTPEIDDHAGQRSRASHCRAESGGGQRGLLSAGFPAEGALSGARPGPRISEPSGSPTRARVRRSVAGIWLSGKRRR